MRDQSEAQSWTKPPKAVLKRMYKKIGVSGIAESEGCSRSLVYEWLNTDGIRKKRTSRNFYDNKDNRKNKVDELLVCLDKRSEELKT